MAGVVKNKKLKYRPVRQDEVLDISLALSQASALLDEVVEKARKSKDGRLLLDASDRWITIAKIFTGEDSEEELNTNAEFQQYGFVYEKENEVKDTDE
jgi:hypothetical protein